MNKDDSEGLRPTSAGSIPDDAFVRRRIHQNDVDGTQPLPILPKAFRPSASDVDGLSVYLDDNHGGPTPAELAASGRGGRDRYVVVAFRVGDLRSLGLSVVPEDVPDSPPGHALIPELNVSDYQSGKEAKRLQKTLQMKLSELASERIVYPHA